MNHFETWSFYMPLPLHFVEHSRKFFNWNGIAPCSINWSLNQILPPMWFSIDLFGSSCIRSTLISSAITSTALNSYYVYLCWFLSMELHVLCNLIAFPFAFKWTSACTFNIRWYESHICSSLVSIHYCNWY